MRIYPSLDADRIQASGGRKRFSVAIWMLLAALVGPRRTEAQLVIENPRQRWQAGETVELVVRERDIRQAADVDAVLFDDQPVPFDLVEGRRANDPIRIRFTVPEWIKPGAHIVSVVSSVARTGVSSGFPMSSGQVALVSPVAASSTSSARPWAT